MRSHYVGWSLFEEAAKELGHKEWAGTAPEKIHPQSVKKATGDPLCALCRVRIGVSISAAT